MSPPPPDFVIKHCAAICCNIIMKNRGYASDKSLEAVRAFGEALQGWLFPALEAEIGNLDKAHRFQPSLSISAWSR